MKTLRFKNPWYNPHSGGLSHPFLEVPDNGVVYRVHTIFDTPLWALAVKKNVPVTMCVSVAGAKSRIDFLLRQELATRC